jgi:hypothetical protein
MIDLYYGQLLMDGKSCWRKSAHDIEAQLDRSLLQNGRATSSLWLLSGAAFGVGEIEVIVSPSFNFWTVRGGKCILMGSRGPRGMQRVIRYCDGWLPNARPGADLPEQITELRRPIQDPRRTGSSGSRTRRLLSTSCGRG